MNSLRLSSIRLILSLLITVTYTNNLHAKLEGYEAGAPAERWIYSVKVNADGSSVKTEEVTYLARTQYGVESVSQADISYNSSKEKVKVLEASTSCAWGK